MISAETYSDDRAVEITFDATPYFEQAADEALAQLIECGFGGDYPADWIADTLAESNDQIASMFTYLDARNRAARESIGFEVRVNEEEAINWLKQHRPRAFSTLNLADYDLAKCENCSVISDRDSMSKESRKADMLCANCASTPK